MVISVGNLTTEAMDSYIKDILEEHVEPFALLSATTLFQCRIMLGRIVLVPYGLAGEVS